MSDRFPKEIPEDIRDKMRAFDDLQQKYDTLGADDTEPGLRLAGVVSLAIKGEDPDWDTFSWSLYRFDASDGDDWRERNRLVKVAHGEMTEAAKQLHAAVKKHNDSVRVVRAIKEWYF